MTVSYVAWLVLCPTLAACLNDHYHKMAKMFVFAPDQPLAQDAISMILIHFAFRSVPFLHGRVCISRACLRARPPWLAWLGISQSSSSSAVQ